MTFLPVLSFELNFRTNVSTNTFCLAKFYLQQELSVLNFGNGIQRKIGLFFLQELSTLRNQKFRRFHLTPQYTAIQTPSFCMTVSTIGNITSVLHNTRYQKHGIRSFPNALRLLLQRITFHLSTRLIPFQ